MTQSDETMSGSRLGNPVRLLRLGAVRPTRTQALYHAVAGVMEPGNPDTLILCSPRSPYLSLGYHQLYDQVLDDEEVRARRLPVFRRQVGGGLTYLDANQVFYQCVFHHSRLAPGSAAVYRRLLAAPVAALRRLGLDANLRDSNEIEIAGRRVAGVGGARLGDACVVVGNLLLDFDFETMVAVWRVPDGRFRRHAGEALRERLTTLSEWRPQTTIAELEALLIQEFERALQRPLRDGAARPAELHAAERFARKMASPGFLRLHQDGRLPKPQTRLKIAAGVFVHDQQTQVGGSPVTATLTVHGGTIRAATLTGSSELRRFAGALEGTPLRSWPERLEQIAVAASPAAALARPIARATG